MIRFLWTFALCALPVFVMASAAGESPPLSVLLLKNGDRITGREVERTEGTIHFQSELLGLIKVPETDVTIESIGTTDLELQLAATEAPDAGQPVQVQPEVVPQEEVAATSPATATQSPPADAPSPPKPAVQSKRQLEFGLTTQSGRRERSDVSLRTTLERITATNEMRLLGRYLYGESDGTRVTDLLGATFRFRQNLSPRMFGQAESRYEQDSIKQIDAEFSQSIGVGRNLIEREGLKLSVGGGTAARFRDTPTQDSEWTYLVDGFQDLVYSINSRLKITQDLSVLMAPFQDDAFLVKLNASLTSRLTNTLNMSMRYEFEYDRSLIPENRDNQRIVTSIGYAF